MDYSEIRMLLVAALKEMGTNPFRAAITAGLPGTAIRHALEGHEPKAGRLAEICDALGLEFYIGPPRGQSQAGGPYPDAPDVGGAGFERFDPEIAMPARGYAKCSVFGHLERESDYRELPAPEDIRSVDPDAFYVVAQGSSMIPEGIREGDYCLVSPNTPLAAGLRVWLKDRQGRACVKRLVAMDDGSYSLRGWQPPGAAGRQQVYEDQWTVANIAERGAVLAVWRGRPDVAKPPPLIPDPKVPADAALPVEIARALDLPAGASLKDAVEAIEARAEGGLNLGALRAEMADAVKTETEALREDLAATQAEALSRLRSDLTEDLADAAALVRPEGACAALPGARPVPVLELAAAAGGGATIDEENVSGQVWFRRGWLDAHGLDATRCVVIGVRGESMESSLPDGCSVLVDRARTRRHAGRLYAVTTGDGLVAKRARRSDDGGWLLASDHPSWDDLPWPTDAETVGEIRWMARSLR